MILKLIATDFGKFKGRTFDLGPVTVVHGANEAGKTTFFDALFQALCRPKETKDAGKLLKRRYGAGRKAEAVLAGDFSVDEDEFLNLCAIRAGDLRLELGQGAAWLERLKSRLFHGGLDPAALAAEFERRSSDRRTYSHMKELDAFKEKAAAARRELESRRGEREALLASERSLAGLEASLEETRRLREGNRTASKEVQAALQFEERIDARRKAATALAHLEEWTELEAKIRELEPFREDRRPEWSALASASKLASERAQADRTRRDLQTDLVAKARSASRKQEEARTYHGARSLLAASLAGDIKSTLASRHGDVLPIWSMAVAGLLLVAGIGGALAVPSWLFRLALSVLALVLGGAFLLLTRRQARQRGAETAQGALAAAKDRFTLGEIELAARHPESAVDRVGQLAEIATLEGFLQAMDRIAQEGEAWERQTQAAKRQLSQLEETLAEMEGAGRESQALEEATRRVESEWLKSQGVSHADEYLLKVNRHAQLREDLARRKAQMEASGHGNTEADQRDLARRLKGLDEEGVPRQGRDEAALQRLRRQAQDLEVGREGLAQKERELIARKERQAGEIRGALGKLAEEIVKAEDDLAELQDKVAARELDKRAAGIALDIFREIGEGSDLLLSGLARELEAMLAHVLPGDRAVALLGLDQKQIMVADAAGGERALENLSSGTRDAVVLAAKLALALKTRDQAGILVLDDPFLAMDREREDRALRMLQDFHLRHGWQIILLTKDALLRDGMGRKFPDLHTINL